MKKLLVIGLVAVGLAGVWKMKAVERRVDKNANVLEARSLRKEVLPKAQATVQAIHDHQMQVSVEDLRHQISELDRLIESSNLIEKLNGNDLDEKTRSEFYQVIEAKQTLLNELVQKEIGKSQQLLGQDR